MQVYAGVCVHRCVFYVDAIIGNTYSSLANAVWNFARRNSVPERETVKDGSSMRINDHDGDLTIACTPSVYCSGFRVSVDVTGVGFGRGGRERGAVVV